jgi:hypothetical protein
MQASLLTYCLTPKMEVMDSPERWPTAFDLHGIIIQEIIVVFINMHIVTDIQKWLKYLIFRCIPKL